MKDYKQIYLSKKEIDTLIEALDYCYMREHIDDTTTLRLKLKKAKERK